MAEDMQLEEQDGYAVLITECALQLGYEGVKDKQMEAILAVVRGKDTFVSLPTGFVKSMIYGVLPVVKVSASTTVLQKFYTNYYVGLAEKSGSIVVCISPLTSLMMDQCTKFVSRGISAEFIGEAQTSKDAIKRVLSGQAQLVFATPESLVENER